MSSNVLLSRMGTHMTLPSKAGMPWTPLRALKRIGLPAESYLTMDGLPSLATHMFAPS